MCHITSIMVCNYVILMHAFLFSMVVYGYLLVLFTLKHEANI